MKPEEILQVLKAKEKYLKLYRHYSRLYDHSKPFSPDNIGVYDWQREFHDAGATNNQRCLMAANRVGKTLTAAAEVACHLTGWYPKWWQGRKFDAPVSAWTGCETAELSKDVIQPALLGPEADPGTGWIPGELIKDVSRRQAGVNNVVDTILVKHKSGGTSSVTLKTYRAGAGGDVARRAWQGTSRHVIWLDEECPMDIYTEALTRTLDCNGTVIVTFTPMIGRSELVEHFLGKFDDGNELPALLKAG